MERANHPFGLVWSGCERLAAVTDVANGVHQLASQPALEQIAAGTELQCTHCARIAGVSRQHDDLCSGVDLVDALDRFDPVHARHLQIHQLIRPGFHRHDWTSGETRWTACAWPRQHWRELVAITPPRLPCRKMRKWRRPASAGCASNGSIRTPVGEGMQPGGRMRAQTRHAGVPTQRQAIAGNGRAGACAKARMLCTQIACACAVQRPARGL